MNASGTRPASDGITVLVCTAVWLAFSITLFALGPYGEIARRSGGFPLEERFDGYGADALFARVSALGADGRALYEQFQVLDGANAILMAIALSSLIRLAISRVAGARSVLKLLALLPITVGVLELAENAVLFEALRSFPTAGSFAGAAGTITQIKLLMGFGSLAVALLCLTALGIVAFARRPRRS